MKIKINNVSGFSGIMDIKTDSFGVPLDKFWRDRLKDAKIDNCIEIIVQKKSTKTQERAK